MHCRVQFKRNLGQYRLFPGACGSELVPLKRSRRSCTSLPPSGVWEW
ncbi:hypothetical protein Lalb_Chr25g0282681 [Lupinus albus]|uniref:Uncharacterized protein n=1 Tax=Lupinus albus TaxID=3870 RepID=A0A6A4NDV2_LUPAL|nr:hypothetical protein Lalb_Chr25g0282681 [Lupinus albus]